MWLRFSCDGFFELYSDSPIIMKAIALGDVKLLIGVRPFLKICWASFLISNGMLGVAKRHPSDHIALPWASSVHLSLSRFLSLST